MNDTTPEALGQFLKDRAKYAKNTCERLSQVSRIDATCWYLSRVNHASARDVKRFITAFKGSGHTYSRRVREGEKYVTKSWEGPEPAWSMLNTAYGGVGEGFAGKLRCCWSGPHYGERAPLYRPLPRTYAVTIAGLERASRVQRYLDRAL
jgi:hypothetical protein